MRTKEEINAAIEKAKERLDSAADSVALTAALNELSRLAWWKSLFEQQSDKKIDFCLLATVPVGSDKDSAAKFAQFYREHTHIKAWPTCEPGEIVVFPVDYGDLIKVMSDLEDAGYSVRVENKE